MATRLAGGDACRRATQDSPLSEVVTHMPGTIVTFYSYKGGVGRSFTLANIAVLLARWGYRVLCVDWDLEAPGLYDYFQPMCTIPVGGVVDLVDDFRTDRFRPTDHT